MATRKPLVLVSGLFQELNTPTDKLDFAGNTTTDLTEGSNQYFTNSRARSAISTANSGTGYGSLSYNSTSGVITYTVVTDLNIRGALSIAAGSGLTYNSTTGVIGTSAIPNSQLANSSLTVGSTSISLGGTATTIAGLTSLTSTALNAGVAGAANSIILNSTGIVFEGSVADAFKTTVSVINPTATRTISLPDSSGTVALLNSISVSNSGSGFGSLSYDNLTGIITYTVVTNANIRSALTASTTGTGYGSLTYNSSTGNFDFAVVTNANIRGALTVDVGSGLTYNSSTGSFGTSAIPNSQLQNSAITIGSTSIALGGTSTTLSGLTSVTSTTVLTNDGGFRVRNSTDNTKQLAFDVSGVTTATTRTLTVQDASGTIALSSNKLSFFAATTSAELAGVISDETGSGALVFATSPSLTTPSLGVATATSINKVTLTAPATSATLTIANGKTLTVSNTLTFTGTDSSSVAFGAGGTAAYLTAVQTYTAAQRGTVTALTSGATVTPDFSASNHFSLTLGQNLTIATPTNLTAGQSGAIVITQGASTAYTVAYGSAWKFSGGTPTMSTGLSSVSTLIYYVESATRITAQLLTNVA